MYKTTPSPTIPSNHTQTHRDSTTENRKVVSSRLSSRRMVFLHDWNPMRYEVFDPWHEEWIYMVAGNKWGKRGWVGEQEWEDSLTIVSLMESSLFALLHRLWPLITTPLPNPHNHTLTTDDATPATHPPKNSAISPIVHIAPAHPYIVNACCSHCIQRRMIKLPLFLSYPGRPF